MSTKVAKDFKLLDDDKKNIIADRMDICLNCPYNSRNATGSVEYRELFGDSYRTSRGEFHCAVCGCILEVKTASLSSNCGLESWNANNPERALDLKWRAVEKEKEK